jgi:flagellar hook-associated protein 1 FlgK
MRSSFSGLETARRAIVAQQAAMDVTAQNLANASTPGYSRRVARLTPVPGYEFITGEPGDPVTAVGGGVAVTGITRLRDAFLDRQARDTAGQQAWWKMRRETLSRVETILGEPSDQGMGAQLQEFWNAWAEVATHPTLAAARSTLKEKALTLCSSFRQLGFEVDASRRNLDVTFRTLVGEVNTMATEIAAHNQKIMTAAAAGLPAHDVADARDLLADRLAALTGARFSADSQGAMHVFIGGVQLVEAYSARAMAVTDDPDNTGLARITWADSGVAVDCLGGQLASQLKLRDSDLTQLMARFDTLAAGVIDRTNQLHRAGTGLDGITGRDFFEPGTTARGMNVSAVIQADPSAIAAAASGGAIGDGEQARAIAALSGQPIVAGATPGDYYAGIAGQLGVISAEAERQTNTYDLLARQIQNHRDAVSGVSPDEEVISLMRFQHAYQAAARVLTVMDQVLDVLINRIGASGS